MDIFNKKIKNNFKEIKITSRQERFQEEKRNSFCEENIVKEPI